MQQQQHLQQQQQQLGGMFPDGSTGPLPASAGLLRHPASGGLDLPLPGYAPGQQPRSRHGSPRHPSAAGTPLRPPSAAASSSAFACAAAGCLGSTLLYSWLRSGHAGVSAGLHGTGSLQDGLRWPQQGLAEAQLQGVGSEQQPLGLFGPAQAGANGGAAGMKKSASADCLPGVLAAQQPGDEVLPHWSHPLPCRQLPTHCRAASC